MLGYDMIAFERRPSPTQHLRHIACSKPLRPLPAGRFRHAIGRCAPPLEGGVRQCIGGS